MSLPRFRNSRSNASCGMISFGTGVCGSLQEMKRPEHARETAARRVDARARNVDAQFETRKSGLRSDMLRRELIDRRAAAIEIAPGGPLDVTAGEPRRIFRPVAVAAGRVLVPEILEQQEIALQAFERLQMRRELVVLAVARGCPMIGPHAVGPEEKGGREEAVPTTSRGRWMPSAAATSPPTRATRERRLRRAAKSFEKSV